MLRAEKHTETLQQSFFTDHMPAATKLTTDQDLGASSSKLKQLIHFLIHFMFIPTQIMFAEHKPELQDDAKEISICKHPYADFSK